MISMIMPRGMKAIPRYLSSSPVSDARDTPMSVSLTSNPNVV